MNVTIVAEEGMMLESYSRKENLRVDRVDLCGGIIDADPGTKNIVVLHGLCSNH